MCCNLVAYLVAFFLPIMDTANDELILLENVFAPPTPLCLLWHNPVLDMISTVRFHSPRSFFTAKDGEDLPSLSQCSSHFSGRYGRTPSQRITAITDPSRNCFCWQSRPQTPDSMIVITRWILDEGEAYEYVCQFISTTAEHENWTERALRHRPSFRLKVELCQLDIKNPTISVSCITANEQ